ncbi:MAG: DsbA family oxidoreductase [Phyllobacteriaceae bacterium]|nr:DsbA family oxidoreductase [Phyllobacteriaceae bacterium]
MSETATGNRISIDVYSDVVCPWCFIGLKRLEQATALLSGEVELDIRWRPFQLDPTIPEEGVDNTAYLTRKFGSLEAFKAGRDRVAEEGRKEGIAFNFPVIEMSPNTLKAHCLTDWAEQFGAAGALVPALFSAYFEQGRDVGDEAVLAEIAGEAGLDDEAAHAFLEGKSNRDTVANAVARASQMGVTSVPCFVIEGRYAVLGAQPAEGLANAFRQIAEAKANGTLPQG